MPSLQSTQSVCPDLSNRDGSAVEWRVSDGLVPYPEAVGQMEKRVAEILAASAEELVWLLEHPAIYTAGTSAKRSDLIDPGRFPVFSTGRGGQYTYHGPGQRIAYVMLDLNKRAKDVRCFVSYLESWLITTLATFGIAGERRPDRVGIWIPGKDGGDAKIAAVGVRVRRWATFHGVAINNAPDLEHYAGIVPCGVTAHGVTSLKDQGVDVSMSDLDSALKAAFTDTFGDRLS
ncbi:MAG: lipoyl(octanoyl) transferase LipB [Alphaproteobacteria bacterium]